IRGGILQRVSRTWREKQDERIRAYMARGDHDTGRGTLLDDSKGHKRRGTHVAVPVHVDIHGLEGSGGQYGELVRVVSRIMADNDGRLTRTAVVLLDERGQALGRLDDGERVHK